MNKKRYSYIMMETDSFLKYQKMCQRDGIPCNYRQINSNLFGVMVAEDKTEGNIEEVEKIEGDGE